MPQPRLSILLLSILVWVPAVLMAQKPVIANVDPLASPMGREVVIVGSGFDVDPANLVVHFGAANGRIIEARENLISVRVPPGTTYKSVSVTNLVSGKTGYSRLPYLLSFSGEAFDVTRFDAQLDFVSENELYDLALDDFDGDGKIDVATANNNSNLINVFKNTSTVGNVSFSKQFITISSPTINVNSRDLDGDGKPDLVVSKSGNPGDRVYYMKNNSTPGTISFASPNFLLIDGNIARRIEIEDLDKDGLPEIIVTNQSNSRISYFKNSSTPGNISFSNVSTIALTDASAAALHSAGLTISDLNGDGFPEIATTQFLDKDIYITPNTSSIGQISFGLTKKISSAGNLSFIKSADMNMDGKNDLIVSKLQQNQIAVLINNGTADAISFAPELTYIVNDRPWGISIGDLNGDGKPEVIVASINSLDKKITVLENASTGNSLSVSVKYIPTTEITRNIKIGDIDVDGKPDIVATSLGSPNYSVSVIRNKNCFAPKIYPTETQNLCKDTQVTLRAIPSRGTTYRWVRSDFTQIGIGPDPFITFIASVGNYDYWVEATSENAECVVASNFVTINVSNGIIPNPPLILDPPVACSGQNVTFSIDPTTILAGATYTWVKPDGTTSTGQSLALTNVQIPDAGRYLLKAFDGVCESSIDTSYLEVVNPPEIAIITNDNLIFCDGKTVLLEVTNDPSYSYRWFRNTVEIPATNAATYSASTSGDYTVEVTTSNNCKVTSTAVTLLAATPPVAAIDALPTSCTGNQITFTSTSTVQSGINVYYNWNFGDGTLSTDTNPVHTFSSASTFNVSLTVSYDDVTCTNTANHSIIISDPPALSIAADTTSFCSGGAANLSITGTFATVNWSTGETSNAINVTTGGNYSVNVTTSDFCQASANIDITEFPLPIIQISPPNPAIEQGESIQLMASGALTYVWDPISGLDDPNISNPMASPIVTTLYTILGIDANNCNGTGQVTVTVTIPEPVLIPQLMFSPNGDGTNDYWMIENIQDCVDCTLTIFDRSGIKVFEMVNYDQSWDGRFNGQNLVEDVYYFVVSKGSDKVKSGSITLIR